PVRRPDLSERPCDAPSTVQLVESAGRTRAIEPSRVSLGSSESQPYLWAPGAETRAPHIPLPHTIAHAGSIQSVLWPHPPDPENGREEPDRIRDFSPPARPKHTGDEIDAALSPSPSVVDAAAPQYPAPLAATPLGSPSGTRAI